MSKLVISGVIKNRQIDENQIRSLHACKKQSAFTRIWDALADFFTQSNVGTAKKLSYEVFHSEDSAVQIKSFLSLRSLAHKHSKSQFIIQPSEKPNTVLLCLTSLDIRVEVSMNNSDSLSLMKQIETDIQLDGKEKVLSQHEKDISRWSYQVELDDGDTVKLDRKNTELTQEQRLDSWKRLSVDHSKSCALEYLSCQQLPQSMALWSVNSEQVNRSIPNLTLVNSENAQQQCNIIDFGDGNIWIESFLHSTISEESEDEAHIGALCKELTLHSGFFVTPEQTVCCYWEHNGIPA
ncbi:MAG: hypothetical protein HAW66_00035 [Shewanella sp.]|nr:hypothetical protein [Shewanella sp.]